MGRREGASLSEITDKIGIGEKGYAFIIGADSTFYAHPNKDYVLNQLNAFKEIESNGSLKEYGLALKELGIGNLGLANYELSGVKRITAMAPIPGTNWMLGIGNYEEEFLHGTDVIKKSILIISLICVIIGVIGAFAIGGFIARPITYLSKIVSKLSDYDLTIADNESINKHAKRTDEIGIIAMAIIGMRNNFIELIKQISMTSQQVAASSEELTSTAQQAATAADEVANAIGEIASGATDQAKETEQGASSVNVLSELITKDQQFMIALNDSAIEVNRLKEEGIDVLFELVKKTKESGKATDDIHDVIIETSQSAAKIESASQMIQNIATQTNLLALNAAIEAARAGEAGRGFAVVADEIRKLAEQSNSFTKEITSIIQELSEKTDKSVITIKEVGSIISSQAESVESTNEKFEGINSAIETMRGILNTLNESGNEMKVKKEEIVGIIENLSAISEENAAGTQQASASVEEQTASMQEIANASDELALLAEEMQKIIAQFKLD
ncbi:MAG: methyl-accepting chemotaxis protein [Firmicutes bacterium HGW-Firmicutes-7]|nr:MAG: methyl-accepting chemotaxis protein [Firmicutes bacterium HGW-Firmicutes-7]